MSRFVPGHFDDYHPPLGENPERLQDTGQINLVISATLQVVVNTILATFYFVIDLLFCLATDSVGDLLDDTLQALREEPSQPAQPQDPVETNLVINEMLQVTINSSVSDPLDDTLPALGEELSHPEQYQDLRDTHMTRVQRVVVTAIRATDLTLGLRRIPTGFHVVVKTDSAECQTSNKPVYVDQVVVEWNEPILLPCRPSSIVRVTVYASFELGPMLCHGEVLRTFEISVRELLDRSEKLHPLIFQPKQGEAVSPCTSLLMTLEQRLSDQKDIAVLCPRTTFTSRDMDALALKTDAGHRLLARYRRTQNSSNLDQSIKHFERALDLCPVDHPYRPAALFNLATAKFVSCQADGRYLDLDAPITLFQDALDLRPIGHLDRTVTQLHLAISLLSRFTKQGFQTDADMAEELLSEVLDVCHVNSHVYRAALITIDASALHSAGSIDINDLGQEQPAASILPLAPDQLVDRAKQCLQRDEPRDLDEVISLHYDALGYYNTGHARRGQLLCNLAVMLEIRFERRGNDKDFDQAIALQMEVLALIPVGHTYRYKALDNLANHLSIRFKRRGNDEDLDQAITLRREALALCPVGHTDRFLLISNLAAQLSIHFHHRSNAEDLDQAIALQRETLAFCPVGHTDRSVLLNNLATHLSTCFDHQGNGEDLDQAIALHREALALRPVGHIDRFMSLNNLAIQLSIRFEHRGNNDDVDQAIALQTEALALLPACHTDRFAPISNLASQLDIRFEHRGNDKDLDQAIALGREALALLPVGHTDRSKSLNNLANQISSRFFHRGDYEDLTRAIALHREALTLRPVGHTDRPSSLHNLANQLSIRFEHRRNDEDLDQAIALEREALALCTVGHKDRSASMSNLRSQLSIRFQHRGNDEDLDQAIALHMGALALCPVGHTDRCRSLNSLAYQISSRFKHRGNDKDLDQAIELQREALALCPVGHRDRSMLLNHFVMQLSFRSEHRGNDEDLDQVTALLREVLALCPVSHTHRPSSLHSLANHLSIRFKYRGNDKDLDQAIALQTEALALHPVGHRDRSMSLNNLANHLSIRFHYRGNDEDLDQAIALHREALALRPVCHTDRSSSLYNLANQLSTRFEHQHNKEDLDESRENLHCALALLTQHDPRQLLVHRSLADVYLSFHHSDLHGTSTGEDMDDLNAAMHHIKAAANVVSGGLLSRLRASLRWAHYASRHSHGTQLEAYATSMQLLDAYMYMTASVSSRRDAMKEFPSTLAVDAASCALRSGDVRRAVELLEQGRTIIWTQMARLRTPLDSLQTRGDHAVALMKRFRDLSSLLDKPRASHLEGTTRVNIEAEETRYRRLVEDWNRVVEEIRKIEGFSRFLLPPLFSDLQDAARDGPLIVPITSVSSCHAIIIPHKKAPTSLQLPINFEKLRRLVLALQMAINKEAGPKGSQPALTKALRELWDGVVCPVVRSLGGFAQRGSRIWWCLTTFFNFLPLHAAGEYRANGESLSQQYISSYTPSLTALIKARRHVRSPSVSFAAIGQNLPAGALFALDGVEPELELVRSLLPSSVSFTKVTSVDATKSRALHALQDNTWLHFACHGTQRFDKPFNSAFLMRDQPLSLLDITQMDLSQHQFAFLSACETALGEPTTPDEVIFGGRSNVLREGILFKCIGCVAMVQFD
ncbi:CHAT domain-containing protein [Suillus plorans]|uniref:CHAT domain-containing protein n=1 Tax=Suillus plorans TaxID=116603 RepID=A0A9P7DNH0_9AGAM|nr:CHAT domain-containing protein [Suillus plorans]KAG1799048.1 CHAT domain-containing protein [Suillus plorans]